MTSVAIVEDHPVFRQGLAQAIDASVETELSGTYRSIEEFSHLAPRDVDVVLLDLNLPGMGGVEGVAAVSERGHQVLVVSASGTPDLVVAAMGAGANGYLTKDSEPGEIIRAVTVLAGGGTYVSPTLASYLLAAGRRKVPAAFRLTDREREILSLLAAGERDQDIAEQLFISIATVRSHLDRIRDKTGRRRRPELTRLAMEEGVTERPTAI